MEQGLVVEWAPFTVRPGVSDAELAAAPGFVARDLLRGGGEREWVDLVVWRDRESAERVMKAAFESPVCLKYFALMEQNADPAAGVQHFAVRRRYAA
jgi:hypothetical protein